jgi:hypothetical protein
MHVRFSNSIIIEIYINSLYFIYNVTSVVRGICTSVEMKNRCEILKFDLKEKIEFNSGNFLNHRFRVRPTEFSPEASYGFWLLMKSWNRKFSRDKDTDDVVILIRSLSSEPLLHENPSSFPKFDEQHEEDNAEP